MHVLPRIATVIFIASGFVVAYTGNMTVIQQAAKRLIAKHGSTRKAQKATGINYAYLSRLSSGEKCNPKDEVLKALGLKLQREYVRK